MCVKRMSIVSLSLAMAVVFAGVMVCMTASMARAELVGHWTFDDVTGDTVPDSAGGDDNGTLHGNAVISNSTAPVAGGSSHALDLGSKGWVGGLEDIDSVYIEETGNLSPGTGPWSIAMWFNTRDVQPVEGGLNKQILYGAKGPGSNGTSISVRADSPDSMYFKPFFRDGSGNVNTQKTEGLDLQPNTWYHIAVVRDGDNVKVYFDGELVGENTATIGDLDMIGGAEFTESIIGGVVRCPNGLIDDVRIYNHAIIPEEIEEMAPVTIQDKLTATWGQIKGASAIITETQ